MTIPLAPPLPAGSSCLPGPSRAEAARRAVSLAGPAPREAPIRHCFRWGLPCRSCCQDRGGLLPHRFTVAPQARRSVLCGAFPRVSPAGRYPAPCFMKSGLSSRGPKAPRGHPAIRATWDVESGGNGVNRGGVVASTAAQPPPPSPSRRERSSARKSRNIRTRAGIRRRCAQTAKIGCGRVDHFGSSRTRVPSLSAPATR